MNRLYQTIGITLLLSPFLSPTCRAVDSKSGITVKIESVSNRANAPVESPRGVLKLKFLNNTSDTVIVPLWLPLGDFRLNHIYGKTPLYKYRLQQPHSESSHGVLFSEITYFWIDEHGQKIETGNYDTNISKINLKPNQSSLLVIPITCPRKNGLYKLKIHFDNTPLQIAESTFNDKHAIFENPEALKYFSADDVTDIQVAN